eukprot:315388-Karenia_brevis.AAC.1
MPPLTTFVSDSWRGTIAAVKRYRTERGYTENQFKHELVNHSAGEVINPRGYSTNAIESRWGVLKRWARYRYGGRLPTHGDRAKWTLLLEEFRFRKLLHAHKGCPRKDSLMRVGFTDMLEAMKSVAGF